jgi:2-polyprenyl-3-methyl-5-hydroxy-6-metoxy-1,4-benzoquinol methylase
LKKGDDMLAENDIRPENLMLEQSARYASDVQRLLQRKSQFVIVPCPACDCPNARERFQKYGLDYRECLECGTMYISPRPPPLVLNEYYTTSENYAYWNQFIFPTSETVRRERLFRPRARRLVELARQYGIAGGVLLEVGAGFGTFCEEVRGLDYFNRVIAVEPTPGLAATCRKRNLEVLELPIEQVQLNSPVDVIASFEVLEHLFLPRGFLESCFRHLAPGGLLMLSCPNGRGFDVAALGPLSDTVDTEHLNYFHPGSLSHLVRRCGFDVMDVLTPGELDAELVRKKALHGQFDLSGQPFLKEVLIDRWEELGACFQRFLAANKLSSHMWMVAQKPIGP